VPNEVLVPPKGFLLELSLLAAPPRPPRNPLPPVELPPKILPVLPWPWLELELVCEDAPKMELVDDPLPPPKGDAATLDCCWPPKTVLVEEDELVPPLKADTEEPNPELEVEA